jgi:predicted transcriptional regulator
MPVSHLRRLKNRDTVVICWELLKALASGPQMPSKLARIANVPYNRLGGYLGVLTSGGLVKVDTVEAHEVYSITTEGMMVLGHLDPALPKLFP